LTALKLGSWRIRDAINSSLTRAKNILQKMWDKLVEAWEWIRDNILMPIIDAIEAVWKFVWNNILKPFMDGVTWLFDNVVRPILEGFIGAATALWEFVRDKIIAPLLDGLWAVWNFVKDNILIPLTEAGTKIWEGLKAGLSGAVDFLRSIGGDIWEGLKAGFGGLANVIKQQLDKVNPVNLFKKMFDKSGAWGKGDVEGALGIDVPFIRFATGGLVPGMAAVGGDSELNDKVLALMSPGEAVIPRSAMGDPMVAKLVDAILTGNLPKFAFGGTVGEIIKDTTGVDVGNIGESLGVLDPRNIDFSQLDPTQIDWTQVSTANLAKAAERIKGELVAGADNVGDYFTSLADQLGLTSTIEMFRDLIMSKVARAIINMLRKNAIGRAGQFTGDIPDFSFMGYAPGFVPPIGTAAIVTDPMAILPGPTQAELEAIARTTPVIDATSVPVPLSQPPGVSAIETFQTGGMVGPGGGLAHPGEFVINRASTVQNTGLLSAINKGQGNVGAGDTTVNVTINTTQALTAGQIRSEVIPEMERQLKRKSQEGAFVLSAKGVRA